MISPVLRPTLWSALLGAVAAAALATPAWAEPSLPDSIPDTGSRPVAAGALRLPGSIPGLPGTGAPGALGTTPGTSADPADGPLMAQINAADALVAQLGDDLLRLKAEQAEAQSQLTLAESELRRTEEALVRAQEGAEDAAADAVKAAAALPPGEFAEDLHDLSLLQRISRGDKAEGATTAAAGEVVRASTAERIAREAYASAELRARTKGEEFTRAEAALHQQEAGLLKLRKDNAARLLEIEKQQDAAEQRTGTSYVTNQGASGLAAHPTALAAVRYALAQLGDPYLWAAEGPDRFDCSGLMLASYESGGYHDLPRVSRDQYYATRSRTVDPNALLPGDLLFFASGSSWTTIHHVAMYIGGGKMVEAPRTGDVVKISVVRWSRLYAATRVVGGVPGPAQPVPSPTRTSTTPQPSPTPTRTTSPSPSGTASPTPTTRTPTRSPSTSPTPTPTPTPSDSPSPTPSPSTSPSSEPTSEPTTQPTTEPSSTTSSPDPVSSTSESTSASPSTSG